MSIEYLLYTCKGQQFSARPGPRIFFLSPVRSGTKLFVKKSSAATRKKAKRLKCPIRSKDFLLSPARFVPKIFVKKALVRRGPKNVQKKPLPDPK